MKFRKTDSTEISRLIELRKKQLMDEGIAPSENIDDELQRFFETKTADNTMVEWVAEENGQIAATAAIVFYDFPPTWTNTTGRKGYITNMYTDPAYRKQGIATALLQKLVEEAENRQVFRLWLGASKDGRPVYRKFGFRETDEWLELNIREWNRQEKEKEREMDNALYRSRKDPGFAS